ncbi:unnamed protein product [Gongylonema pulchrum]|uniref:Transposase n=1 Tax=Gongylonema pulchrum TaxID=637853 RepID=A0A183ETI8_9BILA|nr:unnamed protein product [Gongylonema pulchrum]
MDWIRLTASRSTAARVKSGIDHVELSKHASVNDCWTLLGDQYEVQSHWEPVTKKQVQAKTLISKQLK